MRERNKSDLRLERRCMRISDISFETWCRNHSETHNAKWCRELYPWPVFASLEYGSEYVGQLQRVEINGLRYTARLTDSFVGKNGRFNLLLHLKTEAIIRQAEWEERQWDDLFHLVASDDGRFITLYTERDDPSKSIVASFMRGNFDHVEAIRSKPISALLFRTLVSYRAEELFGALDHYKFYEWVKDGVLHVPSHPQHKPRPRTIAPLRSLGRDLWITYAFKEEKAHRLALYNATQCNKLIVVYCHPTFTRHHRCTYLNTEIVSLSALAQYGAPKRKSQYLSHVRVLMNHLRYSQLPIVGASSRELLERIRDGYNDPPHVILTSYLREAKAGLEFNVTDVGEAAYFFACSNLLNAALTRRYGNSTEVRLLSKDVYSFKQRVGQVVAALVHRPIEGVNIYFAPDGITYVDVLGVQFSFHAIPRTPRIREFIASPVNMYQEWSGRRLQPIAPLVLDWGRAIMLGR